MKYLEPKIEIVVFSENDVLTYSQDQSDIWGPANNTNNGTFNQ